jgi:hypothetical protein
MNIPQITYLVSTAISLATFVYFLKRIKSLSGVEEIEQLRSSFSEIKKGEKIIVAYNTPIGSLPCTNHSGYHTIFLLKGTVLTVTSGGMIQNGVPGFICSCESSKIVNEDLLSEIEGCVLAPESGTSFFISIPQLFKFKWDKNIKELYIDKHKNDVFQKVVENIQIKS